MRTILLSIFIFTVSLCTFFPVQGAGDPIVTRGEWDDEDKRSLPVGTTPAAPEASIDGTTLTIEFTDPLGGLNVTVTDASGQILYQEMVSSSGSNDPCIIILPANAGSCQLIMAHRRYGYLVGDFEI